MISSRQYLGLAFAASLPFFAVSCLSSDSTGAASATVEGATFASSLNANVAASTRTTNGAYVRDISVGTGALVANGQTLQTRYTGWLANGNQFDSNIANPIPFPFRLGRGDVIAGWDEGIPGMHVGGKRQLLIPPSLGYGAYGNGPIPGNAVLVFNVEIVSAQ